MIRLMMMISVPPHEVLSVNRKCVAFSSNFWTIVMDFRPRPTFASSYPNIIIIIIICCNVIRCR